MPSPVFIRIGSSRNPALGGVFGRVLTWIFTVVAVVCLLMVSVAAAGVLLIGGAVVLGYFWWKTRALRRALRERQPMQGASPFGRQAARPAANDDAMIIEGEMIREVPEHEARDSRRPD